MHFFGMGQHTFKKFYDFLFMGDGYCYSELFINLLIQNKNRGEEYKNQWLFTSIERNVKTDILNMQRQLGEPLKIEKPKSVKKPPQPNKTREKSGKSESP